MPRAPPLGFGWNFQPQIHLDQFTGNPNPTVLQDKSPVNNSDFKKAKQEAAK
jgi:hypothetical protein